jgi:hypothetical protein
LHHKLFRLLFADENIDVLCFCAFGIIRQATIRLQITLKSVFIVNMWRQLSFRIFLTPKKSLSNNTCKLNSHQIHHHQIVNGISHKACFKRDFANQREGVSRFLTFRPQLMNSLRKFSEEKIEIKSDATELLDDESWHRIGDSEEIEEFDEFEGVSLERGITGVFDIEEFVDILSQQKLDKIVVIAVPPELNYVDYMVITTGRSPKQMTAIAGKLFNLKLSVYFIICIIIIYTLLQNS